MKSNNITELLILFAALSFGSADICTTDYIEVYDVFQGATSGSTGTQRLITRYCGDVSIFQIILYVSNDFLHFSMVCIKVILCILFFTTYYCRKTHDR